MIKTGISIIIMDNIIEIISSFVPKKLIKFKTSGYKIEVFKAALLFADISGFTKITEKLSKLGKEGTEEVNKFINKFFNH
ncbi:MAG: hypothetical protein ABDH37_05745 [Candidatus Hydrothermales bacterium]